MTIEEQTIAKINKIIELKNLPNQLQFQRNSLGFGWTRNTGSNSRYISLRIIPNEKGNQTEQISILWGEHPNTKNSGIRGFDSRNFGDQEYIINFFIWWLIDVNPWDKPFMPNAP